MLGTVTLHHHSWSVSTAELQSDPFPGVAVTVISRGGEVSASMTDEDGHYKFPSVIPSSYSMRFCFQELFIGSRRVEVRSGETTPVYVSLSDDDPLLTLSTAMPCTLDPSNDRRYD